MATTNYIEKYCTDTKGNGPMDSSEALKHDLRGLLASAIQWSSVVMESSVRGEYDGSANTIVMSQLAAMNEIINANEALGQSLAKTIKTTIRLYRAIAKTKNIVVALSIKETPGSASIVDYPEMLSLFGNLLLNSLQSARESVVIAVEDAGTSWKVEISNDGRTMPKSHASYLKGGPLPRNYTRQGLEIVRSVAYGSKITLDVVRHRAGTTVKMKFNQGRLHGQKNINR